MVEQDVIELLVKRYRERIEPGFLSTGEVALVLGVSEASVKRWADSGKLRCIRTPGHHRKFQALTVATFMESDTYKNPYKGRSSKPTPTIESLVHAKSYKPTTYGPDGTSVSEIKEIPSIHLGSFEDGTPVVMGVDLAVSEGNDSVVTVHRDGRLEIVELGTVAMSEEDSIEANQ